MPKTQTSTPLVAIVGRPNVGKSSLFNRLVGNRQAITDERPGTTRDANYAGVTWNGRHFLLADTAGLHKRDNDLEAKVQDQVTEVKNLADMFLVVVDAGNIITSEDRQAATSSLKTGKPVVLVTNKVDTTKGTTLDNFERLGVKKVIAASAIHGSGSGDILDAISASIIGSSPPKTQTFTTLALLGRPNVGKSSLLNSLVGKQQVIVSETPGTTRDLVAADVGYHRRTVRLLDTAGLRRRGKIAPGIEKYSSFRTIAATLRSDVAAVVMDANEPSVAGDQHIAGLVADVGKGLILVVNKWDLVERETNTQERFLRRLKKDFAFAHWAPVVFTSAMEGLNVTQLLELTRQIATRRETKISTSSLNKVVEKLVTKQPPAGLKNRRPTINYATQVDNKPPTFAFFGNHTELIHFSYQRYLENGLREAYDFSGTPIKLEFRQKRDK